MPTSRRPSPTPILILVALLVALIAAAGAIMLQARKSASQTVVSTQTSGGPGGPFQLIDQTGANRDQSLLAGKWSAVFFGYTYCPDVCPMTMQSLGQAQALLGKDADKFQIVFVSVDPKRDTPKQVKDWIDAQKLPASTIGLTGSQAQLDQVIKAYDVVAQIPADAGSDYQVMHSTTVYLMNPKGQFAQPLLFNQPPDQLAEQIKSAMAGT